MGQTTTTVDASAVKPQLLATFAGDTAPHGGRGVEVFYSQSILDPIPESSERLKSEIQQYFPVTSGRRGEELIRFALMLRNLLSGLVQDSGRPSALCFGSLSLGRTPFRKYFDPEEEGAFDSYGSAGGQYDPYEEKTDFTDIRRNVPGEPGIDYPAYTTLPQTGFTCEGRSRGYYADEVSGCQVFHVCHDVLISSFLCPIGSLFSQKLLTCDWWTKVDCSSSGKYIDVNRNSYQQDDDEMIRNAYAMVSLQSGTDVTKDGLVDPDRTGSVMDYQGVTGRLFDYSPVDSNGNDLRSNFEDYPRPIVRNFLPPYQTKPRKPETSRSYQERFYPHEKSRSPYEDSPIIRVQNIKAPGEQRPRDFQESYRRPNEFNNQFQPSYAPTVPTVTTTTRRFYSPTVPTTFRPSTVAYNKLDQDIDSTDYFFSHSGTKSYVTPPTRFFPNDDRRILADGSGKTKLFDDSVQRKPENDYNHRDSYEDDYGNVEAGDDRGGRSRERFEVRVPEEFQFNRSSIPDEAPLYSEDYRGYDEMDDIETRGSIGLGHALRQTDYHHTLARPVPTSTTEIEEQTTEQYQRDDLSASESFEPTTTPSYVESTIKASTISGNYTSEESAKKKEISGRINTGYKPEEFLKPPETRSKFQINVPDLSQVSSLLIRYSTLDDGPYPGTRTTELPRLQNTFSDDYIDQPTFYDENLGVTSNYGDVELSTVSRFQSYTTTKARPLISSTGQWFSLPSDRLESKIPEFGTSLVPSNRTEEKIVNNHKQIEPSSSVSITQSSGQTSSGKINESNAEFLRPSYPPDSPVIDSFGETATRRLSKETLSPSVTKSVNIDSSESASKPVTQRSLGRSGKKLEETKDKEQTIESSTANALFRTINIDTLKQIEETIEKHNSPYQVTVRVNKDEELVPKGDLINKLITQQGKDATFSDKIHKLEIVKSVEPEIQATTEPEATTVSSILDLDKQQDMETNFTHMSIDSMKNFNTVSLLQLMSELLRLDRAPRPFSLGNDRSDSQDQSLRGQSIAKDVNSSMQTEEEDPRSFEEDSPEESPVPLKDKILGQLAENFGEPLYRTDRYFDLPQPERSLDFQTGLPIKSQKRHEGSSLSITAEASSKDSTEAIITTTAAPRITLTTESAKTVVKTELVPSIGFSFDTDEGREEYVEAVLGGLIEPQPAESEKKEIVVGMAGETMSTKNVTSDKTLVKEDRTSGTEV
ncbi:hypothetical protein WN55_05002 [Dufourea novaeangliae]|uniref:Chitin-binding type-2 domain-containing protein n=1 Tax=Dufourea novaeangliae TaxID=178035 RepID=A0A154PNJ8_DUFNO|nr:hypothetical protein WN55_05002 [Dufourea novaeangliae]